MFHCQIYLEITSLGTLRTFWDKDCLFELGGYKTRMYGIKAVYCLMARLILHTDETATNWATGNTYIQSTLSPSFPYIGRI